MHANKAAHIFAIIFTILDLNQINRTRQHNGEPQISITPDTICERLGGDEAVTPRTIRNHIRALEKTGAIVRSGGRQGKSYHYDVDSGKLKLTTQHCGV